MKYQINVTAKAPGTLEPTIEHLLEGDAWETYDEGGTDDDFWTVVAVGEPTVKNVTEDGVKTVEVDEHMVSVETQRVQIPRTHIRSILVAKVGEPTVKPDES